MKAIESLTSEFLNLLHSHNLLKPLIKSEIKNNILDKVIIDKESEDEYIKKFLKQFGIQSDFINLLFIAQ